jgi:hypothetical protein
MNCLKRGLSPPHVLVAESSENHYDWYVFFAQMHIHRVFQWYLVWISCHWRTLRARFSLAILHHIMHWQMSHLLITLFTVLCVTFVIRYLIITNFIVTVTRVYFWNIFNHTLQSWHNIVITSCCTSPCSEFESRTDCALRWKLNWTFGNWSGLSKKKGV